MKEKLKQLPKRPGVYMMHDSLGNVIYVGKAKNLKNRVSQYFHYQKDRDPKVEEMIQHIHTFNYRVTDTELDALIEECRLIKEIKPQYNRLMKNFKKYLYIKISAEQYPKVTVVNEKIDERAIYFGPFTSSHQVENAVKYLHDFYPIRKCTTPRLIKSANGCLFRQLGTCLGVCTGHVQPDEYLAYIEKIQQLLNGKDTLPVQELSQQLDTAIGNLKFEKASKYKEYYFGLRHVIGKQKLVQSSSKNRNILAVEFLDNERAKLFFIKGNKFICGKMINGLTVDSLETRQSLNRMIQQSFLVIDKLGFGELSRQDIDEAQIIYSYLKRNKKKIITFWIPSTRLKNEISLDATVNKIITRINAKLLSR